MKKLKRRLKKKLTQGLSVFLSALMVANSVTPAFGYMSEKNGLKAVAGNDGQIVEEEIDWLTTYPNGTFAMKDNTVHIYEDGGEQKITIYRLGGREGDATVSVALIPAAASMDEEGEEYNYANAAGAMDYRIRVEDPVEVDDSGEHVSTEVNQDGPYTEEASDSNARDIYGQTSEVSSESDAKKASDSDAEDTSDSDGPKTSGGKAKSESAKVDVTYTELESDEDDPYAILFLDMEFADGEWKKDILISAVDDEEHEPEEFFMVMICDVIGAEFIDTANRTTVCVNDNEEILDSEMGFEVESVRVDKADGTAVLTVKRTGGIQYVSQVDYYTEDGTAEAGKDYVESEGSTGFACGFDEAEITVELIDDGITSTDDVTFYVHLTDPKAGTIDESAAVIEVSLYNSGTAESRTIATMTYMPEALDVSSELSVSSTPIADIAGSESVAGEVVTEENTEVPAESVDVALGEVQTNPRARTFTYTAPMQFGASKGNWKPYAVIAGSTNINNTSQYDDVNKYASSASLLGQGVSGSSWFWRYGKTVGSSQDKERTKMTFSDGVWNMQTDNTIQASLKIDRLYDLYDRLDYSIYFESDRSSVPRKYNAVYAYIGKYNSGNAGEYSDSYGDSSDGAGKYINNQIGTSKLVFNNDGVAYGTGLAMSLRSKAFALGSVNGNNASKTVTDTINLEAAANSGVVQYSSLKDYNYLYFMVETSDDRDIFGKMQVKSAALRRQALNTNPVLRVHTADDKMLDEMRASGNASQKSIAEDLINNKLAPSVSLTDGGTNGSGKLYIGSQLKVTPNTSSATYRIHDKIRLVDKSDNYIANTANLVGGSGNIRLQFSNDRIRTTKDTQFYLDLALDRRQQVLFNYAASIDVDNDGTKTAAEIAAAEADVNSKLAGATMVCGTYSEELTAGTHKYYIDKSYSVSGSFTKNSSKQRYEAASVTNLKSINFHMDPDDVIIFNGQMYAGNEEIPISLSDLELTTLEFQFYDSSCLALVRDMEITSISSVAHYVDYNRNGKLDVQYNAETKQYETVPVGGREDMFLGMLPENSYTASDLGPVVIDGEIYEQFLFVRYNMIPRSLRVPEGADADETCLVIPNFTTIVTNEEANAKQSEEMRGYRAIDGQESMEQLVYTEAASIGYVAFPVGGDYSPAGYVSDGNGGFDVEWNPEWHGSLLEPFKDPEAIALDNTLMPQNGYVVADSEAEINAYLGSMHGNDTFALTLHYNAETESAILGTFYLQPDMGSFALDQPEMGAIRVSRAKARSSESVVPEEVAEIAESDPEIKLPTMKLGVGPADFIMDGELIGFSVGVPIFTAKRDNTYVLDDQKQPHKVTDNVVSHTVVLAKDGVKDMVDAVNWKNKDNVFTMLKNAAKGGADISSQNQAAGGSGTTTPGTGGSGTTTPGSGGSGSNTQNTAQNNPTYSTNYSQPIQRKTSKSFNIALNCTFLWKYSSLSNKFEFYQMAAFIDFSGNIKLAWRWPVPIVYVFLAFGADIPISTGGEWVEKVDEDGNRYAEPTWAGIGLSGSLYADFGGGVGIELANAEIYLNFTTGVAGTVFHEEYGSTFDRFKIRGAMAFRFTLLCINYQLDLIGLEFGYDRTREDEETPEEEDQWYFRWHALGNAFGDDIVTFSVRDMKEEIEAEFEADGMKILWPEDLEEEQKFYGAEDNLPNPRLRAYQIPTVPFEVSGYNSAVSAYSLSDNLGSGTNYQLLTWTDKGGEDHNYLLYLIRKNDKSEDHDNDKGLQNSTLVLSELVSKSADGYTGLGVAHPFDENSQEKYLVIDRNVKGEPDPTGDLDFSAYIESDGTLSVTWTGYRNTGILTASASDAAAEMSRNTVVKHTVIDLTEETIQSAKVVYEWSQNAGYRYQPVSVDESVVVFAEAVHFDGNELDDLKADYDEYYDVKNQDDLGDAESGTGNPYASASARLNYDLDRVYGKYSTLNISVASGSNADAYKAYRFDLGETWKANHTRIDNLKMMPAEKENTYYLAYASTGTLFNGTVEERQMVKQLFLQKLTIDQNGAPSLEAPNLLRTLVDQEQESSVDGVYVESRLTEQFENPYFTNLNFLHGALKTNEAGVSAAEDFFLFGMNGNTYVLDEKSMKVLLEGAEGNAKIQPFFEIKTYIDENGDEVPETDSRSSVMIGADGSGNISAVYTDNVQDTSNNALYICKYDPTIEGWGAPVMLAMNHMQVYEDSQKNGWDHETTRKNYFIDDPDNGIHGGMDQFIFAEPSIALGEDEELLIVTKGTLTNLTEETYESYTGESVTEIVPAMKNGLTDSSTGYYAIAYGIGDQRLGEASLTFDYHNFTEGAYLTPYIRFRNVGDTAIRASEAQPAVIRLMAAKVSEGEEGQKIIDAPVELMAWEVKEHILAGAEFNSSNGIMNGIMPSTDPLPAGIEDMTLYFTVSEDSEYIESMGGETFGWSSLDSGKEGVSYYTVGTKPELSFGSLTVGAEGHTTVVRMARSSGQTVKTHVNMQIHNAGSADAEGLKVKVEYSNGKDENGVQIWRPVDTSVTGSTLLAGDEWKLEMPTSLSRMRSVSDGIFELRKADGTEVTSLSAGSGIDVSGTMELPVEYYDETDVTKAMNLRFTLLCDNEEYTTENNDLYRSLEAVSLFDVPDSMNLTLGNTVEIPIDIRTTRQGTEPSVTVRELTGVGGEVLETLFDSLYYNPETKILTMVPGKLGTGIIRIADINTGSFTDIVFTVNAEGVNISTSNPALSFENGTKLWRDKQYYQGTMDALPYLNDTAVGGDKNIFTFTTFANNIDLYFKGTIRVWIDGNDFGYLKTKYTSDNLFNPVLVNFKNHKLKECEVTVQVEGSDAEFDKYVEFYGARGVDSGLLQGSTIRNQKDTADPIIIYGKSIPADASVNKDAEIEFPIYFIDNRGIQAATVDGASVDRYFADAKAAVKTLKISGNTGYTLRVRDSAAREVVEELNVEWFGGNGTLVEDSWPHYGAAVDTSDPENPKLVITPDSSSTGETVSVTMLDLSSNKEIKEVAVADSDDGAADGGLGGSGDSSGSSLSANGGSIALTKDGLYLVRVTNADGLVQTIPVWVTEVPDMEVTAVIRRQPDEDQMYYMVQCSDGVQADYFLYGSEDDTLDENDMLLKQSEYATSSVSGVFDIPEKRHPYYILKAIPEDGTEADAVINTYCMLAKLTEVDFNVEDTVWQTSFTPELNEFTVRVPLYDEYGNDYDISSTEITGFKVATGSEDAVVKVVQAADSDDGATAVVTVTEGGITNTYTFRFINNGCSCSMTEAAIEMSTDWVIREDERQIRIPLNVVTDRGTCQVEDHNDTELSYRIEILDGSEIAEAEADGETLVVKGAGTVTIRVTAYSPYHKSVTSETVTFTVTKKQPGNMDGSEDDREDDQDDRDNKEDKSGYISSDKKTPDYVNSQKLYLANGATAMNCWVLVDGTWYYAGPDGHALTGWFLDPANGYWYFLNEETGAMKTGWHWDSQDGYWYYLHPVNGEMLLGWQNINEKYYYLNPVATEPTWYLEDGQWKFSGTKARPYGSMYENEQTPDGVFVGSDGARIGR